MHLKWSCLSLGWLLALASPPAAAGGGPSEKTTCTHLLPSWPDAHIPGSTWPSPRLAVQPNSSSTKELPSVGESSLPREARSAKCGGGQCACVAADHGLLLVDCSRAESTVILEEEEILLPASTSPPSEVRLVIMGSELTALHSLGNTSITRIHFKYNPGLSHISSAALLPSTSTLLVLDLRNNNLTSPLNIDGSFERLQFLSLDDNALDTIPQWVSNTPSLVHLSLANNVINHLAVAALTTLPRLQFLNLHKNRLASPPANMRLPMLRSLVLQGNPITSLPPDVFWELPSLEYLDLSHSLVSQLPPRCLSTPTTRPWLLSLAHTPLQTLPAAAQQGGNPALWMDLRGTLISSLDEAAFRPMLAAMALTNVVHADWGRPQLWLHNSALSCDCSAKWLTTNSTLLRHASGRCNDKNIQLRFLDPDYFNVFCF